MRQEGYGICCVGIDSIGYIELNDELCSKIEPVYG